MYARTFAKNDPFRSIKTESKKKSPTDFSVADRSFAPNDAGYSRKKQFQLIYLKLNNGSNRRLIHFNATLILRRRQRSNQFQYFFPRKTLKFHLLLINTRKCREEFLILIIQKILCKLEIFRSAYLNVLKMCLFKINH